MDFPKNSNINLLEKGNIREEVPEQSKTADVVGFIKYVNYICLYLVYLN